MANLSITGQAQRPHFAFLHHVSLACRDLEESKRFYVEVLGGELIHDIAGFSEVRCADIIVGISGQPSGWTEREAEYPHYGFNVDGLLLEKLGLFVHQKPPIPFISPSTTAETLWLCVTALVVGFGEEILVRGYLISRLLRLFGPVMSVLYSSVVFSAWHTSAGLFTVAHTFIWGLVYGWTFTKIRRLYPLTLAHATNNIIVFLWV